MQTTEKMGKVALGNIAQRLCDRCVREDTKQALKGNLQADGVQSRQTLFVRYCPNTLLNNCNRRDCNEPVSYTHLTLPTIA